MPLGVVELKLAANPLNGQSRFSSRLLKNSRRNCREKGVTEIK